MFFLFLLCLFDFDLAHAQGLGTTPEVHPRLTTWSCTLAHGCVPRRTSVVLDSLYHPVHVFNSTKPCSGDYGPPYKSVCNDTVSCLSNCIMEGVTDYADRGVFTYPSRLHPHPPVLPPQEAHKSKPRRLHNHPHEINNSVLELRQLNSSGASVSPRVYLLHEDGRQYEMMQLINREITFDVDVSQLPCGMNSALYLSEMDRFGGTGKTNPGGATYGTGYCDAQCPKLPFINGEANILNKGACCNEFDIWEANSEATAFTAHPCNITGLYRCQGDECGVDGVCAEIGCGLNPYSTGATNFYGPGMTVDTRRTITVVTQFHASPHGDLESIHRFYIQNGTVIGQQRNMPRSLRKEHKDKTAATASTAFITSSVSPTKTTSIKATLMPSAGTTSIVVSSMNTTSTNTTSSSLPKPTNGTDTVDETFCKAIDAEKYLDLGGTQAMGEALDRGMVLVFSLWWDDSSGMEWLDSGKAGRCPTDGGYPKDILKEVKNPSVKFSNIKYGEIGSTYQSPCGKPNSQLN